MVEQGELISWTPASWEPKKRRRRGKREIMKGVVFKPFRDETSEYIVGTYLHPRILGRFTLPNRTRPLDRFFLAVSRVRCRPRLGMVSAETTAYAKKKGFRRLSAHCCESRVARKRGFRFCDMSRFQNANRSSNPRTINPRFSQLQAYYTELVHDRLMFQRGEILPRPVETHSSHPAITCWSPNAMDDPMHSIQLEQYQRRG
jgi:hypothetical protein